MVQDLNFKITVTDAGTAVVQRFGKSLTRVGANAALMGKTSTAAFAGVRQSVKGTVRSIINLRTAFVTLIAAAAIKKLVTTMAEFESRMLRVGAITGAVGAEFERLEDTARRLGETTVFTAREAAGAMQFLAQAGFETNEIIGATPRVLELAAAGMLDLADSADIVTNVMAGLGLDIEDLGRANDVLVKTFTSSNVNLQQLGLAFKFAGPIARAAGVEFEEVATAIGLLGNAGIQGTLAGTSLKNAIAKLLNPAEKGAAIIKELGLNVTDAAGRMIPFSDILRQLEPIANDAGKIIALFGQRAGPGMAALLIQGADAFDELADKLKNSAGVAAAIAERQISGLTGSIKLMQSAFEGLILSLRSTVQPGFVSFFNTLRELFTNLKNAVNITNDLTAAADGLSTSGFGTFLSSIVPTVGTLVKLFIFLERTIGGLKLIFNLLRVAFSEVVKGILKGLLSIVRFWNDTSQSITVGVAQILSVINNFIKDVLSSVGDVLADLGDTASKIPLDVAQEAAGGLLLAAASVNAASSSFENSAKVFDEVAKKGREVTETEKALRGSIQNVNSVIIEQNNAVVNNVAQLVLLKQAQDGVTAAVDAFAESEMRAAEAGRIRGAEETVRQQRFRESQQRIQEELAKRQAGPSKTLAELVFPPDDTSIEARIDRIAALFKKIPVAAGQAILEASAKVEGGLDAQAASAEARAQAALQQQVTASNQQRLNQQVAAQEFMAFEQAKLQLSQALFGPNGLANNLINSGSKKAFKVGKALMLANATAGAFVAIVQALAAPFPLNLILPPIVAVNAFLQVRKIASMKFGGGGRGGGGVSLPSISSMAGQAQAPTLPDGEEAEARTQIVNITVAGFVGDEALLASELGRIIREGERDGVEFGIMTS